MAGGWTVIFIFGPPKAGKTRLASMLANAFAPQFAHYVRLCCPHASQPGVVTTTHQHAAADAELLTGKARTADVFRYRPERCFEVVPELLARLYLRNPRAVVLLEADADPCLRYAHDYDRCVFLMPAPGRLSEVFRTSDQAASALREVMEDTATFAKEIYGLFDGPGKPEDPGSNPFQYFRQPAAPTEIPKLRPQMSDTQLFRFLKTPLGSEVASRIQLQPMYHGLVDSDFVVVNTALGSVDGDVDQCVSRLNLLMSRLPRKATEQSVLYCCDLTDQQDPMRGRLLARLSDLESIRR